MTDKQLEGNKLIAEFMIQDGEINYPNGNWERPEIIEGYNFICKLEYHSSWDWLMPVVEKIENDIQPEGFNTLIENRNCYIEYPGITIEGYSGDSKINAVFKAVVEFIKWYKNYKK